jgi:hypothetical protein
MGRVDIMHRGVRITAKTVRHGRKTNTAELRNDFHWWIVHMTVRLKLPSHLISVQVFSFLLQKVVQATFVYIAFPEGFACTNYSFRKFFFSITSLGLRHKLLLSTRLGN